MKRPFILLAAGILAGCTPQKPAELTRYSIEQLSGNISISGGVFSNDESKLLYSSNETGIFNIYEISIADDSVRQVTNSTKESIYALGYVPGTGQILYSADQEGNELDHIYLLSEAGEARDLTPGEKEKASFYGWSRDRKYMYYGSNLRDPRFFDVYKMKAGEWIPEMIYKNTEGLNLEALSDDESKYVLTKSISTSENTMYLVDRASGQKTEISEADAPGQYGASGFDTTGLHFYYLTDAGGEFTALMEYDLRTGARSKVYETGWDVMYSMLSQNEKYRVIAVNEDGKNRLLVLDNSTGKQVGFPELQDGDRVLLLESCSHQVSCDDIGRVKIPRWITNFTGKNIHFDSVAGLDKLPRPVEEYSLVIQCGGCMITHQQLKNRLKGAQKKDIPVSNYGMAIAYVQGIFNRAIEPFTGKTYTSDDLL